MDQADVVRLQHMRDAASEVIHFCQGRIRTDLDQDRMLVLAVLRDLEIIGEAANRVTSSTRQQFSEIPWDDIVGMRNRLVHGYFDINVDIVWETISHDVPRLLHQIEGVLGTHPPL
jgi:uncharacterized protein with HEPN domain